MNENKLFEFIIKGRLAGANDYIGYSRKNRYMSNKLKQDQEELISKYISKDIKVNDSSYPLAIEIIWNEQVRGKARDIDNIMFGAKFIFDTLVNNKIIADDDIKSISHVYHKINLVKENPSIIVRAYKSKEYKIEEPDINNDTIKFAIEGRLDGTNKHINLARTHWSKAAINKRENQLKVKTGFLEYNKSIYKSKIKNYPVSIYIDWFEGKVSSRSKYRDVDNISFSVKFILDELVNMGIIEDDDPKNIIKINHRFFIKEDDPHIVVALTPNNTNE